MPQQRNKRKDKTDWSKWRPKDKFLSLPVGWRFKSWAPVDKFLVGVAAVYTISFASCFLQWPGLYGGDGIEPVHVRLQEGGWVVNATYFNYEQAPVEDWGLLAFVCWLELWLNYGLVSRSSMSLSMLRAEQSRVE